MKPKFPVSRVERTKRDANRTAAKMKRHGVTHIKITGTRPYLVRGRSTVANWAGFCVEEAKEQGK